MYLTFLSAEHVAILLPVHLYNITILQGTMIVLWEVCESLSLMLSDIYFLFIFCFLFIQLVWSVQAADSSS
jgi:hypothetical protein